MIGREILAGVKRSACLRPSFFLWAILSSFIAQLLGAVAWLQSQQSISIRSDLGKPLNRRLFALGPSASLVPANNPALASFLKDLQVPQKNMQANSHTGTITPSPFPEDISFN